MTDSEDFRAELQAEAEGAGRPDVRCETSGAGDAFTLDVLDAAGRNLRRFTGTPDGIRVMFREWLRGRI